MSLRRLFIALLLPALLWQTGAAAADSGAAAGARGGRVGWGRMITGGQWDIHSDRDRGLADFIRTQTTLNLDPTWYRVDPGKLDQLCTVPFVYVKDLSFVRSDTHLKNIAQYVERGGFLCIDACATPGHTPDMDVYYRDNRAILLKILPGAQVRHLPEDHAIYRSYFNVRFVDLITPDMTARPKIKNDGMHGVFVGDRLVGVIGMYGFECGWPERPHRVAGCMKMIVNIYVYAMTHAGGEDAP